ncbi:hypothetical protein V1512DRAFT_259102 [Lipomyces arxii]|uniref:uncharacterized protein n=1 Tax=Lipomyces arxii TaxID=56418 RepID=UPI0034CF76A5
MIIPIHVFLLIAFIIHTTAESAKELRADLTSCPGGTAACSIDESLCCPIHMECMRNSFGQLGCCSKNASCPDLPVEQHCGLGVVGGIMYGTYCCVEGQICDVGRSLCLPDPEYWNLNGMSNVPLVAADSFVSPDLLQPTRFALYSHMVNSLQTSTIFLTGSSSSITAATPAHPVPTPLSSSLAIPSPALDPSSTSKSLPSRPQSSVSTASPPDNKPSSSESDALSFSYSSASLSVQPTPESTSAAMAAQRTGPGVMTLLSLFLLPFVLIIGH